MSREVNFQITLREQEIDVRAAVSPPDTSVGITGWQIEYVELTDNEGNVLNWTLTDEELDKLYEAMPDPEDFS